MIRHPDTDCLVPGILDFAWHIVGRLENKGIRPRRMRLQQSIGRILDPRIRSDFGQVAADQREIMVFIGLPDPGDRPCRTLIIEGAMMAADIAPGLGRETFGFSHWPGHDAPMWEKLLDEARGRWADGLTRLPPIYGFDHDPQAVAAARENLWHLSLEDQITVQQRPLHAGEPAPTAHGLVVTNPPYGERMGVSAELPALYGELGAQLKQGFPGWRLAVFTGNPDLARHLKLAADGKQTLYNGALTCRLLHYGIDPFG